MEYLFSHFMDEDKVQGDEITGSEVTEPWSAGLELELLRTEQAPTPDSFLSPLHPISRIQGVICSRKDKEA